MDIRCSFSGRQKKKKRKKLNVRDSEESNIKQKTNIILPPLDGDESLRHVQLEHPVYFWSLHLKNKMIERQKSQTTATRTIKTPGWFLSHARNTEQTREMAEGVLKQECH